MDPLKDYPITWPQPLQWGEQDAFGHVNNVVYFKYFENARIAYFESADVLADPGGVGPILASTECRFRLPLTYPDSLRTGARVTHLSEDRFLMEYAVASENHQKVAAIGKGLVVAFDYAAGKKATLPQGWVEHIRRLEGTTDLPPVPRPTKKA